MREIYRKFKILFDAASQVRETLFVIFDVDFQAINLIINNAKLIIIIYFIAKLRDVIVKSDYNFRN